MALEKIKTPRSEKYLAFVRKHPCIVCGRDDEIQAHHIRIGSNSGTGLKPSDYRAIPLCQTHHAESHQYGEATFIEKYKLNIGEIFFELLNEFGLEAK
jgi:hypothetical protein